MINARSRSAISLSIFTILLFICSFLFGVGLFHATKYDLQAARSSLSPKAQEALTRSSGYNGSTSFWYVGASAVSKEFNNGVRSLIQVENQKNVQGVLSFWVSEAFQNNLWAQVGYYIQNNSMPIAFYQIWSLNNRTEITTGVTSVNQGVHQFAIIHSSGTVWKFSVDSRVFGSFDIGTSYTNLVYPLYAMSEEGYATNPFSFSEVTFSRAIQILSSGVWHDASTAFSFGDMWGIKGNLQSTNLSSNEVLIGGSIQPIADDAALW